MIRRYAAVEDHEQQIALVDRLAAAPNAFRLDGISRHVETRRVQQPNRNACERDRSVHDVARRTGDGRNDRAIATKERVQQARLASVRWADEGHGEPVVNDAALTRRRAPAIDVDA